MFEVVKTSDGSVVKRLVVPDPALFPSTSDYAGKHAVTTVGWTRADDILYTIATLSNSTVASHAFNPVSGAAHDYPANLGSLAVILY